MSGGKDMGTYIIWGTVGILVLFLLIGFIAGVIRGLKRSSLHILFLIVSLFVAYFITKPITNALLGISINIDGQNSTLSEIILTFIGKSFDLSKFSSASAFLQKLPLAIASPILFIFIGLITFLLFDIIYLIIARVAFGKKKTDFSKTKPLRWFGGAVGLVEGFLFMFVLFAPITSLTKTYQQLLYLEPQAQVSAQENENKMESIPELANGMIPESVSQVIYSFNDSVIGKVAGAGGLNDALFDGLSSIKINGETIHIRSELINMADVYNEFSFLYNNFTSKNYTAVDTTAFKELTNKFLEHGLFKGVISETVKDLVVNFDDLGDLKNNLPDVVKEIIKELKDTFKKEDFNAKEYIAHDLKQLVNALDTVVESGMIEKYETLQDKSATGIIKFISDNNEKTLDVVDQVFALNVVSDGFKAIGNYASDVLADLFENEEIRLNVDIADKHQMVEEIISVLDELLAVNEKLPVLSLQGSSADIIETLSGKSDLGEILVDAGKVFDKMRSLKVFVHPATEEVEEIYVFDKILEGLKIDLLSDELSWKKNDKDAYQKFFTYLSTPIDKANNLGLLELANGGNFDTVIDSILKGVDENTEILSEILMPFHNLKKATFNSADETATLDQLIFVKITNEIDSKINEISFAGIEDWNNELDLVGSILKKLNQGDVEGKTYIKYLLTEGSQMDKLLRQIVKDKKLREIITPILESQAFEPLVTKIFEQLDKSIGELTGITPTTDTTNLEKTKEDVVTVLETLLDFSLNNSEINENKLSEFGKLLDTIKENAYNDLTDNQTDDGDKQGVMRAVFDNLIWYLTGDDLSGKGLYSQETTFENAKNIKKYLNISGDAYYTINFTEKFSELQDVLDFAKALETAGARQLHIESEETKVQDITKFVTGVKNALDSLEGKDKDAKITILHNTKTLIQATGETLLTPEQKGDPQLVAGIKLALSTTFADELEFATAIQELLEIE